ncbi:MAG TPA: VWA domain-containing protein [Pyrinomonadaceae bacterium]|nr:VWA domain-containing protein [Pyrinomonadaceae bacterium]
MLKKGRISAHKLLLAAALSLLSFQAAGTRGQVATPARAQDEDVVRINANLVQTDVMVFDRNGKFVEGLKPGQFELVVDGKPQPISFFEKVTAGTFDEEAQLAAARGSSRSDRPGATVLPLDRGRLFILFLDDLHLQPGDLPRARDAMMRFVDEQMGQNDEAAIFTASGQLGFLQQMTGDKEVLRIAIKRLVSRYFDTRDPDRTPMTEAQALAIQRNDRGVFDFFVDQLLKEWNMLALRPRGAGAPRGRANSGGGGMLAQAESSVKSRAHNIITQANAVTKNTLISLDNVLDKSAALPGRKVLFFISSGFLLDSSGSTTLGDMRSVTNAAARSGTVIYTVDAHGLSTSTTIPDASTKVAYDPNNELIAVNAATLSAYQEPLHTLAIETGGRALLDSNDLNGSMQQATRETSHYYLLAWKPEGDVGLGENFHRIEVRVKDRPDLTVRVRRGYAQEAKAESDKEKDKKKNKDKKSPAEAELMGALKSLYPRRSLPTSLAAGYTDTPAGEAQLTVSVEVDAHALGFKTDGSGDEAMLDVMGAVVNDEGKAVSEFGQNLTVSPVQQASRSRRRVIYNHQLTLKPGLYQVRVATRDRRTGRAGSATQWLEVPDVKKGGLALSSLFVGETGDGSAQLAVCAERRFARSSRLGFFLYVYNAARPAAAPDVALQIQIFRDNQPVITKPLFKIETAGMPDLARLPYGEDLSLDSLPAGRYVLQVTAIDRAGKSSASQRTSFIVE